MGAVSMSGMQNVLKIKPLGAEAVYMKVFFLL
jgi:hypothetical protein